MVSPSSLKPRAPSAHLLRFLRSQFNDPQFFSPASGRASEALMRASHVREPRLSQYSSKRSPKWPVQGTITCAAKLESSITTSFRTRTKRSGCLPYAIQSLSGSSRPRSTILLCQSHPFSTTTKKKGRSLFRRLFGRQQHPHNAKLQPNDLPGNPAPMEDGYEGNLFNVGRTLGAKATNEPRLRCTEFDENGNVTLVNGEFRKSELIAKYGLLPRDLRKIDSSVLPHMLVRHRAILINLLHLRVLIKSDRVLVFDAYGSADTYTQSVFMYDLEGKLRQRDIGSRQLGALPYEFRALEAVMVSVTGSLEGEFEGVREPVVRVLRALEEDIDRDKLRHLLVYSKRLGSFEQKARLVRDAIEDLLEADDDLTSMYLTERSAGTLRDEHDHQEVEMLLESYHKVCDEIVQASGNLVNNIRNTEEVVKAILDANRNSLMLLDLKFSIGTLGLAAGTLCSALYGMNLKNFIEESDFGFGAVSATCFVFSAVVCAYGLMKLRKVQRVRMWGEGGFHDRRMGSLSIGSRGNWRSESVDPLWSGLGENRTERVRRTRSLTAASLSPMPSSNGALSRSTASATGRAAVTNAKSRAKSMAEKRASKQDSTNGVSSDESQQATSVSQDGKSASAAAGGVGAASSAS